MKRTLVFVLSFCVILLFAKTVGASETNTVILLKIGSPVMRVNDIDMPIDGQGTAPLAVNGRTLLPVRAIIEQMGGTVSWNDETKEVTLIYNNNVVQVAADREDAYINNTLLKLDVPPTVICGRTMLPIRFVCDAFNFDILWNANDQTIRIIKRL